MTPPLSIGSLVEIAGPDHLGNTYAIGVRIPITMQWAHQKDGMLYSNDDKPWYPASSLRLVDEELKIGDWVEVIGPNECGGEKWIGQTFQISTMHKEAPAFGGRELFSAFNQAWFPAKSLRKLTSEEVLCHLTSREPISIEGRLSDIEKRLDVNEAGHKTRRDRIDAIEKRLAVLEGERPEVYEPKLTDIGAIAAIASFGPVPECVKSFIRHETEEAEKRKQECPNGHCMPNNELILISIQRGDEMHTDAIQCPAEAIGWCEKVLDSMREG